jgi:hypothetical protein
MRLRAVGVGVHPLAIGAGAAGHHQVGGQILGAVLEAVGPLHAGAAAAAHIHLAAGPRSAASSGRRHLQHPHPGTGLAGLDGGTGAGGAKADDKHIGLQVPVRYILDEAGAGGAETAGLGWGVVWGMALSGDEVVEGAWGIGVTGVTCPRWWPAARPPASAD